MKRLIGLDVQELEKQYNHLIENKLVEDTAEGNFVLPSADQNSKKTVILQPGLLVEYDDNHEFTQPRPGPMEQGPISNDTRWIGR